MHKHVTIFSTPTQFRIVRRYTLLLYPPVLKHSWCNDSGVTADLNPQKPAEEQGQWKQLKCGLAPNTETSWTPQMIWLLIIVQELEDCDTWSKLCTPRKQNHLFNYLEIDITWHSK